MGNSLILCKACERHIRREETHCPFCDSLVTSLEEQLVTSPAAGKRLSRSAMYAIGAAALATTLSGCIVALYGNPPPQDSGTNDTNTTQDTAVDSDSLIAMYGGPPPPDGD